MKLVHVYYELRAKMHAKIKKCLTIRLWQFFFDSTNLYFNNLDVLLSSQSSITIVVLEKWLFIKTKNIEWHFLISILRLSLYSKVIIAFWKKCYRVQDQPDQVNDTKLLYYLLVKLILSCLFFFLENKRYELRNIYNFS